MAELVDWQLGTLRLGSKYLFAACETGILSRSKSSRRRLFNSVRRRSLRSAIDCLFFLICDGSPTSRDEYPEGMVKSCGHDSYQSVLSANSNFRSAQLPSRRARER